MNGAQAVLRSVRFVALAEDAIRSQFASVYLPVA